MAGLMHTLVWQATWDRAFPSTIAAAEAWFKKGVKQHDPEAEYFLAIIGRQ